MTALWKDGLLARLDLGPLSAGRPARDREDPGGAGGQPQRAAVLEAHRRKRAVPAAAAQGSGGGGPDPPGGRECGCGTATWRPPGRHRHGRADNRPAHPAGLPSSSTCSRKRAAERRRAVRPGRSAAISKTAEQMRLVNVERTPGGADRPAGAPALRRTPPGRRRRDVPVQLRGKLAAGSAKQPTMTSRRRSGARCSPSSPTCRPIRTLFARPRGTDGTRSIRTRPTGSPRPQRKPVPTEAARCAR